MHLLRSPLLAATLLLLCTSAPRAQDELFLHEELLHVPTGDGVTLTVLPASDLRLWVGWGLLSPDEQRTPVQLVSAGRRATFRLDGLPPGATARYQVHVVGQPSRPVHTFHTLRRKGSRFRFAVAADTHAYAVWSKGTCGQSPPPLDLLERTLDNIAADESLDFLVLGSDITMQKCGSCAACTVDGLPVGNKTIVSQEEALLRYRQVLSPELLGRVGARLPLLFVLGDHDGEEGWLQNEVMVWSRAARLFHLPDPSQTYGGPTQGTAYALTSGDLLLVVIDVHHSTLVPPVGPLDWTLGEHQLLWLERTLADSDATFKIVMAEHLLGGLSEPDAEIWKGRGGIRCTDTGTAEGSFTGEQALVQQLLVAHGAQVFLSFQDHVVAVGEKPGPDGQGEGVTYVIGGRASGVAPPATNARWYQQTMDYDGDGVPEYDTDVTGTKAVGYFRISVNGSESLLFEYVRTSLLAFGNGDVVLSFSIAP